MKQSNEDMIKNLQREIDEIQCELFAYIVIMIPRSKEGSMEHTTLIKIHDNLVCGKKSIEKELNDKLKFKIDFD